MNREDLFDLIPAYALGALDPDERAEVEALLAADAEARQLLADYERITGALVLAAPARPVPAGLQDDLRRRLAADRAANPQPRARRSWLPALVGMAAALLLALGALAVLRTPADPGAALYQRITSESGARRYPLEPGLQETTSGELVASADGRAAVIRVQTLPPIKADQTFQLWLADAGGVRSGGLFRFDDPAGTNYLIVPLDKPVDEYRAFGLSLEPAGGSPYPDRPTGPRVLRIELNA